MKNNKVIIIRISDDVKSKYEKLLNENGMNLSKRLKLLINEDIKKTSTTTNKFINHEINILNHQLEEINKLKEV